MSATAAQSLDYVFIPGNGGFPSVISGQDAQARTSNTQEDFDRDSRFSALLEQRGVGHVPFWFARDGVVIRGNEQTAWSIRNIVDGLPNMMPSANNDNSNVIAFPQRAHIGQAFAEAVNPLLKAPDMGSHFEQASARPVADRGFTRQRVAGMGRHVA